MRFYNIWAVRVLARDCCSMLIEVTLCIKRVERERKMMDLYLIVMRILKDIDVACGTLQAVFWKMTPTWSFMSLLSLELNENLHLAWSGLSLERDSSDQIPHVTIWHHGIKSPIEMLSQKQEFEPVRCSFGEFIFRRHIRNIRKIYLMLIHEKKHIVRYNSTPMNIKTYTKQKPLKQLPTKILKQTERTKNN